MKETFEKAKMELVAFAATSVILTSGLDENELPEIPVVTG